MSGFSLPEERLLEGKGAPTPLEPVQLDIADPDLRRWKEKASYIHSVAGGPLHSERRFTADEIQLILARHILGLS